MSLADALDTLYVSGVRTAGQKASIEELAEKVSKASVPGDSCIEG
jgi:hypothetical protein